MNTDPEFFLNQMVNENNDRFPEMVIQTYLEMATVAEYGQHRLEMKINNHLKIDNFVQYDMRMFEEEELNLLENEYINYLGFDIKKLLKEMSM
jgi:hypothetical protein